jgi:hypothetical protein
MKRYLIKKIAQFYANAFIKLLTLIENDVDFNTIYEISVKLNAYGIVYHEIYLD